jgi:hypothetical protein
MVILYCCFLTRKHPQGEYFVFFWWRGESRLNPMDPHISTFCLDLKKTANSVKRVVTLILLPMRHNECKYRVLPSGVLVIYTVTANVTAKQKPGVYLLWDCIVNLAISSCARLHVVSVLKVIFLFTKCSSSGYSKMIVSASTAPVRHVRRSMLLQIEFQTLWFKTWTVIDKPL